MTAITQTPMATIAHQPLLATAPQAMPAVPLTVEYWTVAMEDQDSCDACDATLTALRESVTRIRPVAERLGIEVEVISRTVGTWTQALDHTIAASPTIRAAGLELAPTHTGDSEDRVWRWHGTTSPVVPAAAATDLLVRALAVRTDQLGDYLARGGPAPYVRRYLRAAPAATAESATAGCCSGS